ncbi:hypothetical protein E2C01_094493 [Portunus trituberculatus]|uniref:Uncharacterized protein n=1 Tax=Portunus trituberculatus TaxID=210409 RepID=A0A5B7K0V0_PORTR|nr:hypothetical protein [Portunus trituberculatus]
MCECLAERNELCDQIGQRSCVGRGVGV